MQLKTNNGNNVDIKLRDTQEAEVDDESSTDVAAASYIMMKHHISQGSYHELSMVFPEMPRSCKVSLTHGCMNVCMSV